MDGNDNSGNRIRWGELPSGVRAEVEHRLGARVHAATTQPGDSAMGWLQDSNCATAEAFS
ncbi:hypothetical protein [Nocardia amikacinitolerans]|uniref:hypothetical protein n=1 Tax=Nocardia amikacinitolerans TaxID=756689 RepID=UPI0015CEAF0C|nr:hypothetical protein [Nocardia amikacinitolerans]